MASSSDTEQGQEVCTFCDESFSSADALRDHEVREHPMGHVRELERLIDSFQDGAQKVERLKLEQERLQNTVDRLKEEKGDMRASLADLKTTKQYLEDELQQVKKREIGHAYRETADERIGRRLALEGEVELVDPEDRDDSDDPELHGVEEGSTVPAWSGYEDSADDRDDGDRGCWDDAADLGGGAPETGSQGQDQEQDVAAEHEQKVMEASLRETARVLERIQREAEQVVSADDSTENA